MPEKDTDKELSMDELKDASGGGMGLDRLGSNNFKGKKVQNAGEPEMKVTTDPWDK